MGEIRVSRSKLYAGPALTVLMTALALSHASAASAQASSGAGAAAASVDEVLVTGSRVITNGNDSPTPVTVMSSEQLLKANPYSVGEALNMLPALSGTARRGGANVLNLRGIGPQRNLVLLDGHRLAPTNNSSGVDVNLLPTMLLKRVDIVTGGTSAVYGSDAVSGVINYVMDNSFNGLKVSGQGGISTYNDQRTWDVGIAAGTRVLNDRGHIEFSYQQTKDPGIANRSARPFSAALWSMQGSVVGGGTPGSATNPWGIYPNVRFNVTNFAGLINTGPLAGLQFAQNGVLSPFVHGIATGSPSAEIGGDGGYNNQVALITGQDNQQAFGRFDYDFTDSIKGYAEVSATKTYNYSTGNNNEVRSRAVGYNNAFLSTLQPQYLAIVAAQRAANPLGSFNFSRLFSQDEFPVARSDVRAEQVLFITGLQGSVGAYDWNLGYEHSQVKTTTSQPNVLSNPRLFASLNAVVNPANGQIVCNAALVNPSVYGGCVPLNPFGPTASSRSAFEYIRNQNRTQLTYKMDDVTGSVTGAPFSTWAGPVNMSLSAEYRRLSYGLVSNAHPTDAIDCNGIQFNCVQSGFAATAPYTSSTADFPTTDVTVKEVGYEAQIPLLKDLTFAKNLSLNAAARYTDYSTSGVVWSWKVGATWAINDDLTIRAARSRDIRAPTLQNLFAPRTLNAISITDLHTGTTGQVFQVTQGNPTLTPELADTTTVGFVFTPAFIEGLSVSLDYYRVDIANGIAAISGTFPVVQQICENSNGASPVCAYYARPLPFSNHTAANFPTTVLNPNVNTAGFLTYGADLDIGYSHPINGHDFRVRAVANYQPKLVYDLGPAGVTDVAGAADGVSGLMATPNAKALAQVTYEIFDNLNITVQERWRNSLKQHGSKLLFFAIGDIPPIYYTDLTLNYTRGKDDNMELFLNVKNLFNKFGKPWSPTGATGQLGVDGGTIGGDDNVGRYYTAGVRYKF